METIEVGNNTTFNFFNYLFIFFLKRGKKVK